MEEMLQPQSDYIEPLPLIKKEANLIEHNAVESQKIMEKVDELLAGPPSSPFTILAKSAAGVAVKFPFPPEITKHVNVVASKLPYLMALMEDLSKSSYRGAEQGVVNKFRNNLLSLKKLCAQNYEINSNSQMEKFVHKIWEELEKTPKLMADSMKRNFQELATPQTDEKEEEARRGLVNMLGELGEAYYGIAKEMGYKTSYITNETAQKFTDFLWTTRGYVSTMAAGATSSTIVGLIVTQSTVGFGCGIMGGLVSFFVSTMTAIATDCNNPFAFKRENRDIQNNYRDLGHQLEVLDSERSDLIAR